MGKEENTFLDDVVEVGASLLVGYVISRFVRLALARGQSMVPTIKNNQPIILDCRAYHRGEPKRHDLVAFRAHQKNQHKLKYSFEISLAGKDIEHLHKFNKFMEFNGDNVKISKITCSGKEFERCRWSVGNKHL